MVSQIYPTEQQLNKANSIIPNSNFSISHLLVPNVFILFYEKRKDIDFYIVNFILPFRISRRSLCPFLWCLHFFNLSV